MAWTTFEAQEETQVCFGYRQDDHDFGNNDGNDDDDGDDDD